MTTAWRNRIVGTSLEAPDQLVANPANWRTHPGTQRDALRGSLSEVGWVQQVMVNDRTGFVVDGHARVEEALSKGELVPVLHVDLSPEEEALVLATLDPIGAMAGQDAERLAELLSELHPDNEGLESLLDSLAHPGGMSIEDRLKEWGGMPEFEQDDQMGWKSLIVHFASPEDYETFQKVIGQSLTPKTKSVWYPEMREQAAGRWADA